MFGVTRQCHDLIATLHQQLLQKLLILQLSRQQQPAYGNMKEWCRFALEKVHVELRLNDLWPHCPHGHSPAVMTELFILVLIIIRIQSSSCSSHRNPDELQKRFLFIFFSFLKCLLASFAPPAGSQRGGGLAGRITTDSRWRILPVGRCVRV